MATLLRCLRAVALAVSLLSLAASCGDNKKGETTPKSEAKSSKSKKSKSAKKSKSTGYKAGKVSSKGKKWGGWRWKGKRNDCFYVVKNRCYDEKKVACKAARCKKGRCIADGSAPAKVSCKKK